MKMAPRFRSLTWTLGFTLKSIWKPSDDEFMDTRKFLCLNLEPSPSQVSLTYNVGIWLPPGSEYELPEEKMFQINESGQLVDGNGTVLEKAAFVLNSVSSSLSGEFKDGTNSLSGLVGEVYAMRTDRDGAYASIESDGSYSMTLPKGNWVIDYYIEYDEQSRNYPSYPQQPSRLEIIDGAMLWILISLPLIRFLCDFRNRGR